MFGDKAEDLRSDTITPKVSTILDKESAFEGKMTFEGCVVINGKFKGEIFSEGTLIIGEGGYVEGTIEIGRIQIQGEVRGNINAKDKIEINAPAVVQGDIAAPSLIIKEGALFEGNCSMGRNKGKVVDLNTKL
ncbi:polymer-forming cytoskeletal protein [bacterium]|nr:polymer-forming cytoskeletal protein [bacterium]